MLRVNDFLCYRCVSKAGALGAAGSRLKHTLPDLPYDYTALEPVISGDIMRLHHQKHHATYINNLNAAEEKLADAIQSSMYCNIGIKHGYSYINICQVLREIVKN